MNLLLVREYDSDSETIGKLYFKSDKLRYIYTLEDTYNNKKIPGSTRIPAGQYEITLRKDGKHYEKYINHKNDTIAKLTKQYGIMQLQNVPNFTGILIHIGNTKEDTAGCILTGNIANNLSYEDGMITNSIPAYAYLISHIYPIFDVDKVYISILDSDREIKKQFENS